MSAVVNFLSVTTGLNGEETSIVPTELYFVTKVITCRKNIEIIKNSRFSQGSSSKTIIVFAGVQVLTVQGKITISKITGCAPGRPYFIRTFEQSCVKFTQYIGVLLPNVKTSLSTDDKRSVLNGRQENHSVRICLSLRWKRFCQMRKLKFLKILIFYSFAPYSLIFFYAQDAVIRL